MNWGVVRPVLKEQVKGIVGLETVWEDEPRPYNPEALCIIAITAVVGQGWDECRTEQDLNQPKGLEMQDNWIGNRFFTLTVKVESLVQTDTGSAYQYLETVRDKFYFRGVSAALRAVNCAVTDLLPTVDLTAALDDRNRSIAALDVRFAARTAIQDPARYPYVETWDVDGALHNP